MLSSFVWKSITLTTARSVWGPLGLFCLMTQNNITHFWYWDFCLADISDTSNVYVCISDIYISDIYIYICIRYLYIYQRIIYRVYKTYVCIHICLYVLIHEKVSACRRYAQAWAKINPSSEETRCVLSLTPIQEAVHKW